MKTRISRSFTFALLVACAASLLAQSAFARDEEYLGLNARLELLEADPVLGGRAPAQVELARAALDELGKAGRRTRAHWLHVAGERVELAWASAELEVLERTRVELEREHDRLQLDLARRDAAAARAELDRQRLLSQIRAEEAERLQQEAEAARLEGEQAASAARAEAEQAKRMAAAQAQATALAKKEAALAAALEGGSAQQGAAGASAHRSLRLADGIFARGEAKLTRTGNSEVRKAVALAATDPAAKVLIEVGTDSRELAGQRARALRDALVAAGVAAARVDTREVVGNRRYAEIRLQPSGG